MKKNKCNYVIPMVEMMNVRVEKGFLGSTPGENPNPTIPDTRRQAGSVAQGGESGMMFT